MGQPLTNQVWTYRENGNRYSIQSVGKMKIDKGEWIEGVTYWCFKGTGMYTRDLKTFLEKFAFFREGAEYKD